MKIVTHKFKKINGEVIYLVNLVDDTGAPLESHVAEDSEDKTEEVKWHDVAPTGKMDLVVDLNFRMDSSALYSDIVLPAASWYEKADLNSTDMHSFIHPLSAAIAPVWESKTDWEIFRRE